MPRTPPTTRALPGPCILCGARSGTQTSGAWRCVVCDWPYGEVPDADLPLPRIDVVYYIRFDARVKIGTSRNPKQRLANIRHEELLAFEQGGRSVEQQRHRDFAAVREGGEWFTLTPELRDHVRRLRLVGDPWHLYARWLSSALQG